MKKKPASAITRRKFVQSGAATAAFTAALPGRRVLGANDRIGVGFIGVGNRGGQLLDAFLPNQDAEVVGICDVYEPYLNQWGAKLGSRVAKFEDFRRLLDNKDVDALVIATPDHWHALQTIGACQTGRDVYIEKPLTITIVEGRKMVEAARQHQRIVQVGLHRRSSQMLAELGRFVQGGALGKVTVSRSYRLSNMFPNGIGMAPDSEPMPGLNWDFWLGPRAVRPFNVNIAPYKFRWWQAYSSQMGNWGVHYFDTIRWLLGEKSPVSICALGGRYAVKDARDIPDTMEAVFEFASGGLMMFGQYEASGTPAMRSGEMELRGTQGTLYADYRGYEIVPEKGGQFQDNKPRMEPKQAKATEGDLTALHMRNFLDCVRSRKTPNCDVEQGHLSTVFSHLANISLATRSRLDWDPAEEKVTNNDEANQLLHYEYRQPWKL